MLKEKSKRSQHEVKQHNLDKPRITRSFTLEPENNQRLALVCGQCDQHLQQIEAALEVEINSRGNQFSISGLSRATKTAENVIIKLYKLTEQVQTLEPAEVQVQLQEATLDKRARKKNEHSEISIHTKQSAIRGRSRNQERYLKQILSYDVNFGIGPAGTGKTYLAVACAVNALEKEEVQRIVLVRPAVEAGERLGFLPGDLTQKIDPYLRPLYDALFEMLGVEYVSRLIDRNVIEIAPLAYMRGRTLNDAFIILDEAQNTTREQMKMFLTRIGFGSTTVITGDVTQIDLPSGSQSGLIHAMEILQDVKGISFTQFQNTDVVRHPLVQSIIQAYDRCEEKTNKDN